MTAPRCSVSKRGGFSHRSTRWQRAQTLSEERRRLDLAVQFGRDHEEVGPVHHGLVNAVGLGH